ncbi:type II secretion system protein [Trichocoleus desertorum]|uniref:type II secretion system protein n=1 Tax=Trichocoleus desertorum TaxID=1481672 RepID=UPI00329740A6
MKSYTQDFFRKHSNRKSPGRKSSNSGFTLLEVLVVALAIGSLSAIAAPSC